MPETWELVGRIALLIAAVAGGVKGLEYLLKKLRRGGSWITVWWDERQHRRKALAEITDPKTWPNGSHTISDTVNSLYATTDEIAKGLQQTKREVTKTKEEVTGIKNEVSDIKVVVTDLAKTVENAIINGAARDDGEVG